MPSAVYDAVNKYFGISTSFEWVMLPEADRKAAQKGCLFLDVQPLRYGLVQPFGNATPYDKSLFASFIQELLVAFVGLDLLVEIIVGSE